MESYRTGNDNEHKNVAIGIVETYGQYCKSDNFVLSAVSTEGVDAAIKALNALGSSLREKIEDKQVRKAITEIRNGDDLQTFGSKENRYNEYIDIFHFA